MGEFRAGAAGCPDPVENHKLLYVSLEVLVWAQLLLEGGPYGPL